ncbi:MAG: carbohydrate kinase family protein [Archaeoglobaceae archaeon]
MSDAVGFGALNLDKIFYVDKIPSIDEEGYVKDVKFFPGGSAANTIVGLSRLGLKTAYIGKVGSDEEGRILLEDLVKEGVETGLVVRSEGRSGVAMIFVDESGNRAILVDPGVNDTIRYDEIDVEEAKKYRLLHLTSFICKNSLDSLESQKRIVGEFDLVSFDPGMPYAERGLEDLEPIIRNTTVFLPSRAEIELLFNMSYEEAAEECLSMGVEVVVVKLGSEGCYVRTAEKEFRVPPMASRVVDTTGAGDAFNAGFLYGYLKGKSVEDCAKLGSYVAARCIEKPGAREGLPRSLPDL